MKTQETLKIEQMLLDGCFAPNNPSLAKEYGIAEATVGFQRDHKGHERVDFLSYDARNNIFKCYEIKVSMNDFKSDAKKSWYGNYNYLAITEELYNSKPAKWWKEQVPVHVGIIVFNTKTETKKSIKKAVKVENISEYYDVLKDSLIRCLFYENNKRRKNGASE